MAQWRNIMTPNARQVVKRLKAIINHIYKHLLNSFVTFMTN